MKTSPFRFIAALIIVMVVSCDDPETIVTNYVHTDGSVTRKIEMRNAKNNFKKSDMQVSLDSTWAIRDSSEISKKGDTIWIKRAEKNFKNVSDINLAYKADSGANRNILREAAFKKSFKWFYTEYRFSEKINKTFAFGYPVRNFLNDEELLYFYSPERIKHTKEQGTDSLKYRILADSVKKKTDYWTMKNLVSEWIGEFLRLIRLKAGDDITAQSLRAHENEFVTLVVKNDKNLDSLWKNGIILKELVGEANSLKYKTEADTAIESVTSKLFLNFKDYSVRIVMPGKVIGTNGFVDSSQVLLWPVKSDYFLADQYEMWAESRIPNLWAWIVSGVFLVFVLTGVLIKVIKKG